MGGGNSKHATTVTIIPFCSDDTTTSVTDCTSKNVTGDGPLSQTRSFIHRHNQRGVDTNYLVNIADITDADLNSISTLIIVLHNIDDILAKNLSGYTTRRISAKVVPTASPPYIFIGVEVGFDGGSGLHTASATAEILVSSTSDQIQHAISETLDLAYKTAFNVSILPPTDGDITTF